MYKASSLSGFHWQEQLLLSIIHAVIDIVKPNF